MYSYISEYYNIMNFIYEFYKGSDLMAIAPTDFNVGISPNPIRVTIGMSGNVNLTFSNSSLTSRGYNLSVTLTLPDGVSYAGGVLPPTSTTNGPDGTLILSWINIKDLAPNEIDYVLSVILKSDEIFRETGLPVPYDIPLSSVVVHGTVDTLPRGNDDPGNVQITKTDSSNFIPLRYNLTKVAPGKMPKGAGLLSPVTAPRWPYQYTLIVENNSREYSTVTLIDNLPNGVRFLDTLTVTGPDNLELSSPNVTLPSSGPQGQNFVTIDWGSVTLSPDSVNTIVFDAAIWDNYTVGGVENSGSRISHLTPLQNTATLNGLSGPVQSIATINAMDTTINKKVSSLSTDVGQINNYTLTYRINQYDSVGNVVVTDTISNGQTYNVGSASLPPINPNPPINLNGTTTLDWNLGLLATGTTGNITFSTTTSTTYSLGGPVSAGDFLSNNVTITGTNQSTLTPTPDNSSINIGIGLPHITKEIINYYYKDGSLKTSNVVAPGDRVEFKITYSSIGLTAPQLGIEVDEYAPLNMGPLTPALPVAYGGTLGSSFTPVTVSPNGLRWSLATVPGNSLWTANFIIPVANIDFIGIRNNLAKLAGFNTLGLGYSDRSQVEVTFGEPNITFSKTVSGPNVNAIKSGENYTYSITISNPENLDGNVTDAFEMDLTDIIPTGLTYTGNFSVTGNGIYSTPVFAGQHVSMTIHELAPGESLIFNYTVLVSNSVVSGQSYINNAVLQRPYSQPDRSYQYPGAPFTSSVALKALGITITKLISPILAKIGDTVTYILEVTVPVGTTAYNVHVTDTFPNATQTYVAGSATKDGLPIIPTVVGGTVAFPTIPFVDATSAAVTILYAFDIIVINGTHISPFIENQTNNALVNWDIDNAGTPAIPFSTSANLQVRTPNLISRKEQRNVTLGGVYTSSNVNYNIGDIVQYRITLTNTGTESAFNSVLTDIINPFLSFNVGSITTTNGTASVAGATLTWNIPVIAAGNSATLTFTVTTVANIGSDGRVPDSASFIYNTNNNGLGINYGPIITNTVQLVAPSVTISKTPSITQGKIGDNITYTITVTVPNGTIAYTPILTDTLPVGQTYIGPAMRRDGLGPVVTVVPTVSGQNITFPTNPNIDASTGTRTLTYTFVARITNATHSTPFQETQTDTANINWGRTSSGNRVNKNSTASIIAKTPNITILKEQKNVSHGESYTTSNISGFPGDVIYYRLTITSNGASPAFNINLNDILSSNITFIKTILGPTSGTVTPPAGSGGILNWHITQLDNGFNAVYEFQISINSGIGAGDSISNAATATYDSNDVNPITYNQNSNQTIINIPLISFDKTANTDIAAIGSTINYTLTITIPNGVSVNNLSFTDVIPAGQNYVPLSFGGTPPPTGILTATTNQLIYKDSVASRIGPLTLIYTFSTIVISGTIIPPYAQMQRNSAVVQWDITPLGPLLNVSDFYDVTIKAPHIHALKEQRLLPDGSFTTTPLMGIATDDVVEYRITLTNDGSSAAYNVVTTDILDSSLTYLSLTSVTPPSSIVIPPPSGSGGTVNWTINAGSLATGDTAILIFKVKVNAGPAPGTAVYNESSSLYDTFTTNPTTLGPAISNQVAFNYNEPIIEKSVDNYAVFVGDTVNYTVKVTIPKGNIAYNIQLTDTFPPEQTFNTGTLKVNGDLTNPVSTNPLLTPAIPMIDATIGEVTVIYTFSATVNSISSGPQQAQINIATVDWTLDPNGLNPGTPQSSDTTVYVTNSDITLVKTQSNNIGGPFTSSQIQTSVGSTVYYKLSVSNPGPNTIFDVIVNDTFHPLLQVINVSTDVGSAIVMGNTIEWVISSISPPLPIITYNAIVSVLVLPGGGTESSIPNFFTAVFDALNPPPEIEYGPKTSNTVLTNLPPLKFIKTASNINVELGDIITYTLSVIVPKGTIAYHVAVSDTLPNGQTYVENAFIRGYPVLTTEDGQTINFPVLPIVDATAEQVTLIYTFDARVVTGNNSSPYIETQTDNATVNYAIDSQGTVGTPLNASLDVTVNTPSMAVLKSHRNVTQGTGFRIIPISVNASDIVRYQLQATSFGASPAYNVVITDVLDSFEQFIGVVLVSAGDATYNPSNQTVTWKIGKIPPNEMCYLIFDVQVIPGISAGGSNTNSATYIFDSNLETPIQIGPIETNKVVQNYPNLQLEKSSNISNTIVGNTLTYTILLTIPFGTIAYNVQLFDILHIGQQYKDNATLNGIPILPDSVAGQLITFPVIPFVDATDGEVNYVYTFDAQIISANVDPITLIETQTNASNVNWFIDPQTPADQVSATTDVNVSDSLIQINKLQRNVNKEDRFTDQPITGYINQTVEYNLTVTNTGSNTVYNVSITDALSNDLAFLSSVSVPVGTLTHTGGSIDGLVTWTFSPLNPGDSVTAIFSTTIVTQPTGSISNFAKGNFEIKPGDPNRFQAINSNEVLLDPEQPYIRITGCSQATILKECNKKCVSCETFHDEDR